MTWTDPDGGGVGDLPLPGKSQVATGYLHYASTDPLEEQLDPMAPIAYQSRSMRPSVNYVDD